MRRRLFCIALVCAFFSSGCATIFNGKTSEVSFETDPEGIKVTTTDDGRKLSCKTPCSLTLMNSEAHIVKFTHPDFRDETRHVSRTVSAWFWVNIVFGLPGVALMGVDYYTGSMWTQDRESLFLEYEKDEEEEEEGEEEEDQDEENGEDDEETMVDEAPASPPPTVPDLAPSLDETGIASWPDPPPDVQAELEARYPQFHLDQTLRHYYGDVTEAKRLEVKRRVYRALFYQMRTQGETDLDMAISLERHDSTR